MRQRITKRVVDGVAPAAKDAFVWDTDVPGFGLKITPAGRRTFILQYRLGGRSGSTKRLTLGHYGVITAEEARSEAKKLLGIVARGEDPATRRLGDKELGITVGDALERFFRDHVRARRKVRTVEEYVRTARLHLIPRLGKRPLASITRADIAGLHQDLRDKPYQANRTVALLSKFFNWSEQHGLRPEGSNPCRQIEKYREIGRERFLSGGELVRLGASIRDHEETGRLTPWMAGALRLLLLTGARLNEILTLRWSYFDEPSGTLRLPDSKTGAKVIHLAAPALEILRQIPRSAGNPYVICGERQGAHLVNFQKPWRRVRAAAGLEDVRVHDLRHTFASVAARQNLSLPTIGALLGHSQAQTTARYAHFAADPLKTASASVAHEISLALTGRSGNSTEHDEHRSS